MQMREDGWISMATKRKENKLHIINIADIHFGAVDPDRLYNELKGVFLEYVKENAKSIDLINLLGDYFHRKLSLNEKASKLAIKFMSELLSVCSENNIKVRMIRGTKTHDFNQLENFRHYETKLDFRIINTVEVEEVFPNFTVLYLPEEYMENPEEYYKEFFDLGDAKYDCIFFHGTFDFVAFDSQKQETERHISSAPVFEYRKFKDYAYGPIIGGHIHRHQIYKDKIIYCGSLTVNNFGEEGETGFIELIYDIDTIEYELAFIENTSRPTYATIDLNDYINEDMTFEEKVKIVEDLKSQYDNLKIRFDKNDLSNENEVTIFREILSKNENIKVDYEDLEVKAVNEEEEEENKYEFIIKRIS